MPANDFKQVGMTIEIPADVNRLLTQASERSRRSKTQEVIVRLEDHLKNFPDIASSGRRFRDGGVKG